MRRHQIARARQHATSAPPDLLLALGNKEGLNGGQVALKSELDIAARAQEALAQLAVRELLGFGNRDGR